MADAALAQTVDTGYTVTSNPGNITAAGTTSPITVTGLTNGTAYTFTVTATNSAGRSLPSAASNSVTPTAPASPITPPVTPPAPGSGGGSGGCDTGAFGLGMAALAMAAARKRNVG